MYDTVGRDGVGSVTPVGSELPDPAEVERVLRDVGVAVVRVVVGARVVVVEGVVGPEGVGFVLGVDGPVDGHGGYTSKPQKRQFV